MAQEHELLADNVDAAVTEIIDLLHAADHSQDTQIISFWFAGWNNLGASSVLRAIAGFLKSTNCDSDKRNHFGKIIHVDCSIWKNRRAMQKIIAQQLGLHDLMPLFDKEDEEDDFKGVDDSSRGEIKSVGTEIFKSLQNERFLVIFHCETDKIINLNELGIPLLVFGSGKVLWTNRGRFRTIPWPHHLDHHTCVIYHSRMLAESALQAFHEEAIELIRYTGMDSINPDIVLKCYSYLVFLIRQGWSRGDSRSADYGWITHACNYWVCDGILQGDRAWEIGDALHELLLAPLSYSFHDINHWSVQVLSRKFKGEEWISSLPYYIYRPPEKDTTSYFLTGQYQLELETYSFQQAKSFQQATNLRVLKLCNCSFDFSSPPFLCCENLRFLWLEDCTDNKRNQHGVVPSSFPNLWVFDIRFTEYVYILQVAEMMRDLRELNVKGVSWKTISQAWKNLRSIRRLRVATESSYVDGSSPMDTKTLELLDLSGNTNMRSLPDVSFGEMLKMLVLDGCFSLEHVKLERAPMLEIFSFDGYGPAKKWAHSLHLPEQELRPKSHIDAAKAKVSKISLEGCARLQTIYLRGLPDLQELDLSGTALKRLDLGAMDVPRLKCLLLIGCEKLRSLLWDGKNPRLQVLHFGTTRGATRSAMCCEEHNFSDFVAEITFLDARSVWSAMQGIHVRSRLGDNFHVHLHNSSTVNTKVHNAKHIQDTVPNNGDSVSTGLFLVPYMDVHFAEDVTHSNMLWDCSQLKLLCLHLEIGEGSYHLDRNLHIWDEFTDNTKSLHVHGNSITAIPPRGGVWKALEWCHVDDCPKLQSLFSFTRMIEVYFSSLVTFSAIHLPMAYCIWEKGINNTDSTTVCFSWLKHLYLNNCPRLVHVLPVSFNLQRLETIQIENCSNLRCVFPLDDKYPENVAGCVEFLNLKHIKLQYLHSMEQICGSRVLYAPKLETVSVRDCWGLRRLPAISDQLSQRPVVRCEKDWWDKLEWDGWKANHHPTRFEARYSTYYKKSILKVSVLR